MFIIILKRKTNTHSIYIYTQTHIRTHMYTHTHTKLYQFMVYVAVFPVVPVSTPSAGAAASHVTAEGHCHHSTLVHGTGQSHLHCFAPCCLLFMPQVKSFTLLSSFSNSFFHVALCLQKPHTAYWGQGAGRDWVPMNSSSKRSDL